LLGKILFREGKEFVNPVSKKVRCELRHSLHDLSIHNHTVLDLSEKWRVIEDDLFRVIDS